MYKIGFIDQDILGYVRGKTIPPFNISLMKTAAYHKNKGDYVTLLLEPNDLESYDMIYLFKEKPDGIFMNKLMTRKNVKFIGSVFKNLENVYLPDYIFEQKPYIDIYAPLLRKLVIRGATIKPITITRLETALYLSINNGIYTNCSCELDIMPSRVFLYDQIFQDDNIFLIFTDIYKLNKYTKICVKQYIKTINDLTRLLSYEKLAKTNHNFRMAAFDIFIILTEELKNYIVTNKLVSTLRQITNLFITYDTGNLIMPMSRKQNLALHELIKFQKQCIKQCGALKMKQIGQIKIEIIDIVSDTLNNDQWIKWYKTTENNDIEFIYTNIINGRTKYLLEKNIEWAKYFKSEV